MSNKMLIDASHPEETRVAVVRGNRIEEFDFESQEKKQLRGNIYLAKVTRVEPSLQAAFIDYGGNRHGFLAFSEIHPDYYQIPVADRQALLEAEAEEARAAREADDADDGDNDVEASEEPEEAPKKKPRKRRSRKKAAAEPEVAEADSDDSVTDTAASEAVSEDATLSDEAEVKNDAAPAEASSEADEAEEKPKPKRRSTRRKPAPKKAAEATETSETPDEDTPSSEDDDGSPQTMAAMVEMDSISEPLPEDDDSSDEAEDASDAEPTEEPKKRKTSRPRRISRAKKAEAVAEEDISEQASEEAVATEAAEEPKAEITEEAPSSDDGTEASGEPTGEAEASEEEAPKKPKRQSRRRSPRKKAEAAEDTAATDADDDTNDADDAGVESVGQEDALEEVPTPRRLRRHYKIQEVIKRRQVLLVQVVKEERGTKGAALTTYLSLAGRYSVLMPNTARGGGISRKITNSADRKRLKAIASELEVPAGMGVILRTAGAARTKDEINRDFEYLMRLWEKVRNLTLSSSAPCLVYEEGSLVKRSIRDLYDKDTGEVIVAGEEGYKEAHDFMNMLMPSHAKKVKHYTGTQAIFAKYGVESHLDKMVSPQVTLKSGGYLVINQTEALVAVDVNSGRSTREHSVEDTALQTNLEAAEEVARQLRLRDLAGLIVIDFIDMEERRNNRSVEKRLKDCLKNDRARIQVGRISHFGLMEMSRQRMRASVLESTMDMCAHCAGTGYVRSDSAIALHVFRAIEEHVARHNKFDCVVKTSPSIAIHILNHKRAALLELETTYGLQIFIEGTPEITGQEFNIEKGGPASGEAAPAAIAFSNNAEPDEIQDENGEEDGKRKRGRRRKRKNQDEASEQSAETEETSEAGNDTAEASEPSEGDEEQPSKKRRRGKRGGRRNRSDEPNTSDESSTESTAEASSEAESEPVTAKADPSPVNENLPVVESEEVEKPKSRSTRRKKAPIAPKPEPAPEEAAPAVVEPQAEEAKPEEPPRPKRRTTRRVAAKVEPEAEVSVEESAAPETASAESVEASASEPGEASDEDGKSKKKGWWGRGGGFF